MATVLETEIWGDRLGHHPDHFSLFTMGGLASVNSVLGRDEMCTYWEVPDGAGAGIPEEDTPLLFQYWRTLHNVFYWTAYCHSNSE